MEFASSSPAEAVKRTDSPDTVRARESGVYSESLTQMDALNGRSSPSVVSASANCDSNRAEEEKEGCASGSTEKDRQQLMTYTDNADVDSNVNNPKEKKALKKKKNKAIKSALTQGGDISSDDPEKKSKKKKKKKSCPVHGSTKIGLTSPSASLLTSDTGCATSSPSAPSSDACAVCTCKKSKTLTKRPEPEGGARATSASPAFYEDDFDAFINSRTILFSDHEEESGDDERYLQEWARQQSRRSAVGGGNQGLFTLINSNTMMKYAIIGTELQNVLNVSIKSLQFSLKRVTEKYAPSCQSESV